MNKAEQLKKPGNNSVNRNHNQKRNMHSRLKVCTLSGTDEVGRNSNFIEFDNEIIVVDCGISFPEHELYGVDYLIPNFRYLKQNKKKIKAILITHGHLDHTGALPYILPELGFPDIYAGRFANALIKERLKEFDLDKKVKLIDVRRNNTVQLGQFKAKFIGVTHSIPNSYSIFVETKGGNVFLSGDYKIDETPVNEPESDYSALKSLRGKVDVALMESTNSSKEGKAVSEREVGEEIEKIVRKTNQRVVIAAFSSRVSRLYLAVEIAKKTGRKLFPSGKSLLNAIKIARNLNYIDFPDNLIINERQVENYPKEKVLFLCTGSQGERYGALNRISTGEHKHFKVKPKDLIILSSSDIPGNEFQIQKMTDRLIRKGADIIKNQMETVHSSGHGNIGDIKMMYDMVRPKAVIPIHGTLTMRYLNKLNYVRWGMAESNVLLTEDGQFWRFENKQWKKGKRIDPKPILIDGLGVGDVGDVVIKDRQQLAEFGMVIVIMNLSSKTKSIIGNPRFISRGFVYVKASKKIFDEMNNIVKNTHKEWSERSLKRGRYEIRDLQSSVEKRLAKYIYKKTEREPMIMTSVI